MSDPRTISPDSLEILVARELRKAGIEPVALRRRPVQQARPADDGFAYDLVGRLAAYGHRWSVLIECRNSSAPVRPEDIADLRQRADATPAASAIMCAVADIETSALLRARDEAIPVLRVVDARTALLAAGMIEGGQLPAWVPEFTVQVVTVTGGARLLEADQPELILQEMRAAQDS